MSTKPGLSKLRYVLSIALVYLLAIVIVSSPALAVSQDQARLYQTNILFYDLGACDSSGSNTLDISGDPVAKFLQALAFQENGGKVIGTSGSNAQGKFQYIDSTWQSSSQAYYPPAEKYAHANDAPEEVQDAVAYLEYVVKFKEMKGDIFKIAVSHFYPLANADPSKLDQLAPNNVITPRQYADSVIKHLENGDGKSITFKFQDAPEFDKWLAKAGGAPDGSSVTNAATASTCACSNGIQAGPNSNTIVLDPGHSPTIDQSSRDAKTGLYNYDYENDPEMANAFIAAQKIEKKLKAKGYSVVLTKKSANEKIDLSERARRANETKGALLYTMHSNQDGVNVMMYPDSNSHRSPIGDTRKDGTDGLVNPGIAKPSEDLAKAMAPVIASDTGRNYQAKSFYEVYGANGLAGNRKNNGNTPVQTILSSIPEVYSEVDESLLPTDTFADASVAAITKALKPGNGNGAASSIPATTSDTVCGTSGGAQAAVAKALEYAWPDGPHGLTPTDAYERAVAAHPREYHGGCHGADCGAFVTRVMRDSGADKNYNKDECNTVCQKDYLDAHPELYENLGAKTSTKDLQPGDIAITRDTHTFIYVGEESNHPDFKGNAASASKCTRMPNADNTSFVDAALVPFTWYRLKAGG